MEVVLPPQPSSSSSPARVGRVALSHPAWPEIAGGVPQSAPRYFGIAPCSSPARAGRIALYSGCTLRSCWELPVQWLSGPASVPVGAAAPPSIILLLERMCAFVHIRRRWQTAQRRRAERLATSLLRLVPRLDRVEVVLPFPTQELRAKKKTTIIHSSS